MHRSHPAQVTLDGLFEATPSVLRVALNARIGPQIVSRVDINREVVLTPQRLDRQHQDALDDDHRGRLQGHGLPRYEPTQRSCSWVAAPRRPLELAQMLEQELLIHGVGVVEVVVLASAQRKLREISVVMVASENADALLTERFNDLIHHSGLAAYGSTAMPTTSMILPGVPWLSRGRWALSDRTERPTLYRLLPFSLILLVLPTPAQSYSTEGCKGRRDPYGGNRANQSVTPAQVNSATTSFASTTSPRRFDSSSSTPPATTSPVAPCTQRTLSAGYDLRWQALHAAADRLGRGGFGLIVYDCYRPWAHRSLCGAPARGVAWSVIRRAAHITTGARRRRCWLVSAQRRQEARHADRVR